MTNDPRFIHLRTHSEYSLLEGALRLKKLPQMCRDAGMPAMALTDTNNMFAALEFSVGMAGAGVQPIIGCQVDLAYVAVQPGERPRDPAPVVLLAQTETGYAHLMKLNSCLYIDKGGALPQVTMAELAQYAGDVICLTGGPLGPVGMLLQNGQRPAAEALMAQLKAVFGDMWSCSDIPVKAGSPKRSGRPNAGSLRWPMRWAFRWSPRMTSIFPMPRCTRRMTR